MTPKNYLFNFAVSHTGGGYKRLYEYARVFQDLGGATFLVHPRCAQLRVEFPANRIIVVHQPRYRRVFDDCGYLNDVVREIGEPDMYYAYGIPIYRRVAPVTWFHLSNVLPLGSSSVPLSTFDRLKLAYLGRRIRRGLEYADVISAESEYSLGLIDHRYEEKLFLSINGSNDELAYLASHERTKKEQIATIVGTYRYKALDDSWRIFEMLNSGNPALRLVIIGSPEQIPAHIAGDARVTVTGALDRSGVFEWLRRTRYYISTTRIENSFNAAAEGVSFADESYLSDIGPHRELLKNAAVERVTIPGVATPVLHVAAGAVPRENLKTWEQVVADMLSRVEAVRASSRD